jgi:uncharacterized protein (TIGR02453 family)
VAFTGWPAEAFDFYEELEVNNDRTWWLAHKDVYDAAVKAPFDELADATAEEFGSLRLFRPNRDVRFSKDKSPYKTTAAAMTEREGGSTNYVQISADGLFVGAGMYHLAGDQLQRWRDALLDDRIGAKIAAITGALESEGYEVGAAESLKTAPRGWDKAHPRIELARQKGLVISREFRRAKWQSTKAALDRIVAVWRDAEPLCEWLDAHVGPSELPPDGR